MFDFIKNFKNINLLDYFYNNKFLLTINSYG